MDERLLRARAEAEVGELRDELEHLQEERLRLARRNERLTSVLLELRDHPGGDEGARVRIDDALDYDGRETPFQMLDEPDEASMPEDGPAAEAEV